MSFDLKLQLEYICSLINKNVCSSSFSLSLDGMDYKPIRQMRVEVQEPCYYLAPPWRSSNYNRKRNDILSRQRNLFAMTGTFLEGHSELSILRLPETHPFRLSPLSQL